MNKNIGIILVVFSVIAVLIVGFSVGYYMDKNNDKDANVEKEEEVKLNYSIKNNTLYVNDKSTNLNGEFGDIYKIDDVLVFAFGEVSPLDVVPDIYVVDKDATVLYKIKSKSLNGVSANEIETKGSIIRSFDYLKVVNKDIYITSDNLSQDPQSVACSNKDDYVVMYTEKFTYLGNGKLSSSVVSDEVTSLEYRGLNSITCD